MRQCGDCQLCCKLLPVRSLDKGAGEKCKHQRHHKGCSVYSRLGVVSPECRIWSCRWLTEDDTAELSRPDRSHYVIDIMPDHVTLQNNETGAIEQIQVVQIWVDPGYPDAHRDPALRAFLERRAKDRIIGLVRYDNTSGMGLFPPSLSEGGKWIEYANGVTVKEHSIAETLKALGGKLEISIVEK